MAAPTGVQATRRAFFLQDAPRQGNTWLEDSVMRSLLERLVMTSASSSAAASASASASSSSSSKRLAALEADLTAFGERCGPPLEEAAAAAAASASASASAAASVPRAGLLQGSAVREAKARSAASPAGAGAGGGSGAVVVGSGDVFSAAKNANMPENEPVLQRHDGWGGTVSQIRVSEGWKHLHDVAAEEGLIALGYGPARERFGEFARVLQVLKLYLFAPVSALYNCPLAMTDGAARCVEDLLADREALKLSPEVVAELEEHYAHLTSRDPEQFWTSGQWMTERTGGSDVGGTETLATPESAGGGGGDDGNDTPWHTLSGYKYFTSATTSEMAFALARVVDPESGKATPGSRGLSLFLVDVYREKERSILVHRLKDKLGTRQVPTAELELIGTRALRCGPPGRGVPLISSLFNVTRIHNFLSNCASIRAVLAIARDYAHRRTVFGKTLAQQPLHLTTLADAETLFRATAHFTVRAAHLFGRAEYTRAPATARDNVVLRVLTPLGKLWIAKTAVAQVSELLESFGGAGYMEDTGLPRALRDVQVGTIWEGTTNVLSLDTLRALAKHPDTMPAFVEDMRVGVAAAREAARVGHSAGEEHGALLVAAAAAVDASVDRLERFYTEELKSLAPDDMTVRARQVALSMARCYAAALLLEHAAWEGAHKADAAAALRFASNFGPLVTVGPAVAASDNGAAPSHSFACDRELALDLDPATGEPRGAGNIDAATGRPRARL